MFHLSRRTFEKDQKDRKAPTHVKRKSFFCRRLLTGNPIHARMPRPVCATWSWAPCLMGLLSRNVVDQASENYGVLLFRTIYSGFQDHWWILSIVKTGHARSKYVAIGLIKAIRCRLVPHEKCHVLCIYDLPFLLRIRLTIIVLGSMLMQCDGCWDC